MGGAWQQLLDGCRAIDPIPNRPLDVSDRDGSEHVAVY